MTRAISASFSSRKSSSRARAASWSRVCKIWHICPFHGVRSVSRSHSQRRRGRVADGVAGSPRSRPAERAAAPSSSGLLGVDTAGGGRESAPHREVSFRADQAVGDEGIQNRQEPLAASLLIQDVGEGDTTGGGGGLGGAENMDKLGGDPVGAGRRGEGTGGILRATGR